MSDPYHSAYDVTSGFKLYHDSESDLQRWFNNYRVDKDASFASKHQFLTITERKSFSGGRRQRLLIRYVGEIGNDNSDYRRKVDFDVGAPPPPILHLPIRAKKEPNTLRSEDLLDAYRRIGRLAPPSSSYEYRMRMYEQERNLRDVAFNIDRAMTTSLLQVMLNTLPPSKLTIFGVDIAEETDRTSVIGPAPKKPPEPRWRRNQ